MIRTKRSAKRRLGLIGVTIATFVTVTWAIFPSAAQADGTIVWENAQGLPEGGCPFGAHWILSPSGSITGATLHVEGQAAVTMTQGGEGDGAWHGFTSGAVTADTEASADFTGTAHQSTSLKVSNCLPGHTTTTTSTGTTTHTGTTTTTKTSTTTHAETTTSSGTTSTTTSVTVPSTTTTTGTTTTPGGTTTTTGTGSTTTQTSGTTTMTTTPGGTTTSTTRSPTVGPTTVQPTSGGTVGPTTVAPGGGLAFTGLDHVVPLGAIALILMTAGSGMLWATTRRKRGSRDES